METEALGVRVGELRREDVRAALGDDYFKIDEVRVVVVGRPGEMPSAACVQLTWARGGRGEHRMLMCPRCCRPKRMLFTDGKGGLACAACLRRRTRQQREKRLTSYLRHGGQQEDRLLRLLHHPGRSTPGALALARSLAGSIIEIEQDRLAALRVKVAKLEEAR